MVDPDIRIKVTWSIPHPEMAGRDLADIASEWNLSQPDAARAPEPGRRDLFPDRGRGHAAHPRLSGRAWSARTGCRNDIHPHPRLWGTFPRVLGRYCREEHLFPLETAVHKMTGMSAANFGLADRGEIRVGAAYADLVIFDAAEIADRATFEDPKQPAAGIDHVIVNGTVSWSHGGATGSRSGRYRGRR